MKNQQRTARLSGSIFAIAIACVALCIRFSGQSHRAVAADDVSATRRLSFIHTHNSRFVDENDKPVILKGCNLGNWLLNEMWMFGGCIEARDEAQLHATLTRRFGSDRMGRLMDLYRSGYITERDFDSIRSLGFNVVRLPIDYRLIQSDEAPFTIRPDAFKWLDRAVDLAEGAGIYIILDLHSAPGGQSNDQCTGEAGQNKLWGSPSNQQRTVDIWRAIAARYHDRPNVAAYDLLNEPYADHKMDVRPDLRKLMSELYTAIRTVDEKHIVFYPGALGQYPDFYGDPHQMGQRNVAFTEHFYPGLFGDKVAFESHIRTLSETIPARQAWLDKIRSPYCIGEFNPVLDATGGAPVARAYFDTFAKHGWAGTLWSYKLIKPDGGAHSNSWYIATNADPLPRLSIESSSYEVFQQFFNSLATVPMAINTSLSKALTEPPEAELPVTRPIKQSTPPTAAPVSEASLLRNGSFEDAGDRANQAVGWNASDDKFAREIDWKPTHSGAAEMGYHHWQVDSPGTSEISQSVPVVHGKRYRFSVFVLGDNPKGAHDSVSVELRLEGALDGHPVTLNTALLRGSEMGVGEQWTQIAVDGTALGDNMRVRIIARAAATAPRGGALKFDDAALTVVGN